MDKNMWQDSRDATTFIMVSFTMCDVTQKANRPNSFRNSALTCCTHIMYYVFRHGKTKTNSSGLAAVNSCIPLWFIFPLEMTLPFPATSARLCFSYDSCVN